MVKTQQAIAKVGKSRAPVTGTALSVRKKKSYIADIYSTAVGKKYAMAISGIALMGFVLFHMIGNLKMYLGAAEINSYAEFLKKLLYPLAPKGAVLWMSTRWLVGDARVALACCVVVDSFKSSGATGQISIAARLRSSEFCKSNDAI